MDVRAPRPARCSSTRARSAPSPTGTTPSRGSSRSTWSPTTAAWRGVRGVLLHPDHDRYHDRLDGEPVSAQPGPGVGDQCCLCLDSPVSHQKNDSTDLTPTGRTRPEVELGVRHNGTANAISACPPPRTLSRPAVTLPADFQPGSQRSHTAGGCSPAPPGHRGVDYGYGTRCRHPGHRPADGR